jgi:hypothetical protein
LAAHLIDGLTQSDRIDQIELVGLVDRGFELGCFQNSAQVDKGADRARHRNAETNPAINGREPAAPVNSDAAGSPSGLRWHRHLDRPGARASDPPERCGALVAEERIGATRQDSGTPTAQLVHVAPTHDENTSMKSPKPAASDSMVDRVIGEAEIPELGSCDRTMLPMHQLPDSAGVSVSSPPYGADK